MLSVCPTVPCCYWSAPVGLDVKALRSHLAGRAANGAGRSVGVAIDNVKLVLRRRRSIPSSSPYCRRRPASTLRTPDANSHARAL